MWWVLESTHLKNPFLSLQLALIYNHFHLNRMLRIFFKWRQVLLGRKVEGMWKVDPYLLFTCSPCSQVIHFCSSLASKIILRSSGHVPSRVKNIFIVNVPCGHFFWSPLLRKWMQMGWSPASLLSSLPVSLPLSLHRDPRDQEISASPFFILKVPRVARYIPKSFPPSSSLINLYFIANVSMFSSVFMVNYFSQPPRWERVGKWQSFGWWDRSRSCWVGYMQSSSRGEMKPLTWKAPFILSPSLFLLMCIKHNYTTTLHMWQEYSYL